MRGSLVPARHISELYLMAANGTKCFTLNCLCTENNGLCVGHGDHLLLLQHLHCIYWKVAVPRGFRSCRMFDSLKVGLLQVGKGWVGEVG